MEIPAALGSNIQSGNVVLLLGSGASLAARNSRGDKAPSTKELGGRIADKFLGPEFRGYPLSQIAEIAINETDLVTVQEFIREVFEPFEPTEAHELLCRFKWYGLVTTNFDRIVEKAYGKHDDRATNPIFLRRDSDAHPH